MTPLFHRIKEVKPNNLIHQFKRHYFQIPTPRFVNQTTSPRLSEYYFLTNTPKIQAIFQRREQLFNVRVRFFAAPVQIKKKEVKIPIGRLRLNDEIKAEFIRLVTDEGHSVISRTEALQRAKSFDLDLVEVDRNEKPPVCKIYDYNREKYKKKVKDKERAKIKSAGSLKRGECKEVRFSVKTEQKDLNMKADTIKRLMERGYRVKCTATGSEDDDLSGMISQLSALIEDVAFVEFGPKTERRQAYLIVRHIKYGLGKKGGSKAKDKIAANPEIYNAADASPAIDNVAPACSDSPKYFEGGADSAVSDMDSDEEAPSQDQEESTWSVTSVSSAPQNFDKVFDLSHNVKGSTSFHDKQMRFDREAAASTEYNNASRSSIPRDPSFTGPNARQVPQETENRYARSAAKNTSVVRNSMRFPNNGTHPHPHPQCQPQHQPHLTVPPPNGQSPRGSEHNPPRNAPLPRDEIPQPCGKIQDQLSQPNSNLSGSIVHRQQPINGGSPALKSNGFGVFSSLKVNANIPSDGATIRGPGVVTDNLNPPTTKFDDGPQKSESADKKWGIFSK